MDISRNTYSTTKTDLGLLIECLKFQMKCPESQKQALLSIYSICLNREDNVDLFREMGGVTFLCSLSKSNIVHPDVKETALFTLGTLAEANVYCKTQLCRKDTFSHLATLLMTPDNPVTLQRVSVYLLSVLVANNKLGQTFAQNTGCLDILLEIFRISFPFETSDENPGPLNLSQMYQLWTSAANALCGCVNNPQNEDAQRISVAAYPLVKSWLQRITVPRPEIFQPLCFFIAMSVGNNASTQESFSASGCLEMLTRTLVRLAADAGKSLLCCQIAVIITRTLSSCITDNAVSVRALAQYYLVPQLVSLLSSTHLDAQDRLPVLLTLGYCTEASGEHQLQLVHCGGLSVIIALLTECPTEELRKAVTFILQTCKQATMTLGGPAPGEDWEEAGAFTNMDAYWKSANELLNRIRRLEKGQQGVACPTDTTRGQRDGGLWRESLGEAENHREFPPLASAKQPGPRGGGWAGQGGSLTEDSHVRRKIFTSYEEANLHRVAPECEQEGVRALPQKDPGHIGHVHRQASECHTSPSAARCNAAAGRQALGCVLPFEAVTSRTFWALQSSCRHSCDMHRVLQEASDAFRSRRTLFRRKTPGGAVASACALWDASEEVEKRQGGGQRGREAGTSSLTATGRLVSPDLC
ncbi:hypothetical protein CRUP_031133 [Coryphaenoides rupestris]|nr:hypothetical protein CRUP_031133 [Coryphaenoides rupestris]